MLTINAIGQLIDADTNAVISVKYKEIGIKSRIFFRGHSLSYRRVFQSYQQSDFTVL